jgi:hypothetical protein
VSGKGAAAWRTWATRSSASCRASISPAAVLIAELAASSRGSRAGCSSAVAGLSKALLRFPRNTPVAGVPYTLQGEAASLPPATALARSVAREVGVVIRSTAGWEPTSGLRAGASAL